MNFDVQILDRLRTDTLPNGMRMLLYDLHYVVNGINVTVHTDFVTDYSSFPWYARWIVRWSKVDYAGVLHDYLLSQYYLGSEIFTRKEIDEIWRICALVGFHSAKPWQARLPWFGIRINSIYQEILLKFA